MPTNVSPAGAHQDREPTVDELKRELREAREQQAATAQIHPARAEFRNTAPSRSRRAQWVNAPLSTMLNLLRQFQSTIGSSMLLHTLLRAIVNKVCVRSVRSAAPLQATPPLRLGAPLISAASA